MYKSDEYHAELILDKNGYYVKALIPVSNFYASDVINHGRIINACIASCSTYEDKGVTRCSYCGCEANNMDKYCEACGATFES